MDSPRWVLCPGPTPAAQILHGRLSIFAASVANRWNSRLVLKGALLWDDSQVDWTTHFADVGRHQPDRPFDTTVGRMRYVEAARNTGISEEAFASTSERNAVMGRYAKCFGAALPRDWRLFLRAGVRDGAGAVAQRNASWTPCSIMRFENGELAHEFLHCGLPGLLERRWAVSQHGPPKRLHLEVAVLPTAEERLSHGDDRHGKIALELCRVDQPLHTISFCTMPLYGYGALRDELPWAFEDFLDYHLAILGFGRADLYDVDGSFAEAVMPRAEGEHNRITYHGNWPSSLSARMASISTMHPSCTETWAYAHCLTTHRALSKWTIILHSPDEYVVPRNMSVDRHALMKAVREIEAQRPKDDWLPFVQVLAVSWARGGLGQGASASDERGGVLSASRLRGRKDYRFTPLLDPAACTCAGPHACYKSTTASTYGGPVITAEPELLKVAHYTEMLNRDRGRCDRIPANGGCSVEDASMQWAAKKLRALSRQRKNGIARV